MGGEREYRSGAGFRGPPLKSYLKPGCRAPCHPEGLVSGSCRLQPARPLRGGLQTTLCLRNLPGTSTPGVSALEGGALKGG